MKEKTKNILIGVATGIIGGGVLVVVDGIFLAVNIACIPCIPIYAGIMGYAVSKDRHKNLQDTLAKGIDIRGLQDATRKDFQKWKIEKMDEAQVPEHIREFLKK